MDTKLPDMQEMNRVLKIRKFLRAKESLLFRTIKDIEDSDNTSQEKLEYFQTLAITAYDVSKFKSMVYYIYLNLNIKHSKQHEFLTKLANYLIGAYYIRNFSQRSLGEAEDTKFDSVSEGIRWILSYRLAKQYMTQRISSMYEATTNQTLQICIE